MTAPSRTGTRSAAEPATPHAMASDGRLRTRRVLTGISAAVGLGLSVWCAPACALLPPLPQAFLDAHVTIEGIVVTITHTDKDLEREPRELGGRRRVERTFDMTVKLEKTVKGRDPAATQPPSGDSVVIHGTELIGPATEGGVYRIDQLVRGTRARFHLERHDDGAWFILTPDGLVLLDSP